MTGSRIVVVSPHLDDAVLSLGATIAAATRAGQDVSVLTVFAGEPDSAAEPSSWDVRAGFRSAGEAGRARRAEDAAACATLGARAVCLEGVRTLSRAELGRRLRPELAQADLVLIPGYPCTHADHELVSALVLEDGVPGELALYVEQPYAMWRLLGQQHARRRRIARSVGLAARAGGVRALQEPVVPAALRRAASTAGWEPIRATAHDRWLKQRASLCYRSQFRLFGLRLLAAIALYEWAFGGEAIGRLTATTDAGRAGSGSVPPAETRRVKTP
ncbi:MAG TPA: PIG-L family deacetylase [Gaiellaceae bacterium]|jgi:LmbE family N-acetylglucosaminyl deacetylase|nr:PIG-L family deacetylase [Gaiellaceae bacterium]